MLIEITIENFAIIESLHLNFYQGMNALTGETGAGKSIIIDAMGLLAGGRGSVDMIRQGAEKCRLEGVFEWPTQEAFLELAETLGIDQEEDFLIVQRDMSIAGKSICRVNGRVMTLANLRKIGAFLVDIQGQNDHQALLQPEQHLRLVDEFGTPEFTAKVNAYQQVYHEYRMIEKKVKQIKENEQSYVQRMDMLHFQLDELAQADLQVGEEELLIEERDKLANFQKIVDTLGLTYQLLTQDGQGTTDQLSQAMGQVENISSLDKDYEKMAESLQSAYYLVQEVTSDLSRQLDSLEFDEQRLEEIYARLEVIRQLKRKYGESIEAVLAYYEQISKEVADADHSDEQLAYLVEQLTEKEALVNEKAQELHDMRQEIAEKLEQGILQELKELYMENTDFQVRFDSTSEPTDRGIDKVAFYLSTNLGEPLKPLVKVASGGELSRILLALKTVFSRNQALTSIVFDEVDTGVSGRVAQAIAQKIATIGQRSQVLCITHLPQVAAFADHQYFIQKEVLEGRTKTTVHLLSATKRVQEVARMLAGAEVTPLTLEHAQELLEIAKQEKTS